MNVLFNCLMRFIISKEPYNMEISTDYECPVGATSSLRTVLRRNLITQSDNARP